jgi:diguanylate cyclase (GGDEF)-like protein/PAS domain S-box-containing protein
MPIFKASMGSKTSSNRRLLVALGCLVVLFEHAMVLAAPRHLAVYFAYIPLVIANAFATWLCWKTSQTFLNRGRLAWRLLAVSRAAQIVGWLVFCGYELVLGREHPLGNAGDFAMILADFLMIGAFIVLMTESSSRENWLKSLLDGTTVCVAYFLLTWLLFLSSASGHAHQAKTAPLAGVAAGTLYVLVNIVCIAFAFLAFIRDRLAETTPRAAVIPMGVAALFHSLTSIGFVGQQSAAIHSVSYSLGPAFLDATLLICAAAYIARHRKSDTDEMLSVSVRAYASTFTVLGLICITSPAQFVIKHGKSDLVSTGFGGFMVGLVIFHQLLLLNENVTLNEDLEIRVEKRSTELTEREQRFRALVTNSSDVITILDEDGIVKYVSPSVHQVFGYQPESWLDWRLMVHVEPDEAEALQRTIDQAVDMPGEPVSVEWSIRHHDGTMCKVESSVTALLHEPSVRGVVLNTRDVSERRALEHRLRHQASHDTLTGLANRSLFKSRMAVALDRAQRAEGSFALLFCDLDAFKAVNDSLGHVVGDEVLIAVASRLRSCVRPGDTVARLGGDEFAVILEHIESDSDAAWIAERIKAELAEPVILRGKEIFIGASVGIATSSSEYEHLDDLLAKADIAMYMAKSRGKGNHVHFDPEMHESILRQIALEEDLRNALAEDQLVVYYQPIHDLDSSRIVSFEALVRWIHPKEGLLGPNDFIPMAEQTGIIVDIGRWVLEQACIQLCEWQVNYTKERPLTMSVNLSGRQLQDPNLIDEVSEIIKRTGINPRHLTLEMTESMLLADADTIVLQLERLRNLGVKLAIDDFGTGYSSLSYLQHFPVDVLKIDRSFVKGLGTAEQDLALVQAIMSLGSVMNLETVAEGIENPEELEELQKIGCHLGQGYLFAKPATSREISQLLTGEMVVSQATQKSSSKNK